ncbi:hypothetical protein Bca4012_027114 [Brassica carinata]
MYPRFNGMMPFLPSRQQAQALLIERELKLKQQADEERRLAAFREDFISHLREYSSPLLNELQDSCRERDAPGHHDLKHKGVEILMIEGDNEPIEPESEPIVEESFIEPDEYVNETMMKPDVFSESLEGFTSDLQIVDVADQKENQNKSDAEEIMGFSFGNKIEHMVGKQPQEADRVWEPGGLLAKPDSLSCLDKYLCHDLNLKAHEIYSQKITARCIPLAKETSQWTEKKNSFLEVCSSLDLEEFKTLGKRSNNTLYLKDKQEDECEAKQRVQVVQKRPHKIRTSKDKNNDVLFSMPFGDIDARFQEIVTTALGVGVFLECCEKLLRHEKYRGLCSYLNVQRKLANSEIFFEVRMVKKRTKVIHEKIATHQTAIEMKLKEVDPTSLKFHSPFHDHVHQGMEVSNPLASGIG